jgi:hypothetical protein
MLICPTCGKQEKMIETLRWELAEALERINKLEGELQAAHINFGNYPLETFSKNVLYWRHASPSIGLYKQIEGICGISQRSLVLLVKYIVSNFSSLWISSGNILALPYSYSYSGKSRRIARFPGSLYGI